MRRGLRLAMRSMAKRKGKEREILKFDAWPLYWKEREGDHWVCRSLSLSPSRLSSKSAEGRHLSLKSNSRGVERSSVDGGGGEARRGEGESVLGIIIVLVSLFRPGIS